MNILVLTAHTKNVVVCEDYGKLDYIDVSSINHIEYCNKHSYTYLKKVISEDVLEYHATWLKIKAIREVLDDYDYVVWIDSDAIFYELNFKIEEFIVNDADLIIPKHEIDENTGILWTTTTTGFMIWKNSDWSRNMLDYLWNNMGVCRYGAFHEQTVLDDYLRNIFLERGYDDLYNKSVEELENNLLIENIYI